MFLSWVSIAKAAETVTLNPSTTYQTWGAWMTHEYACDTPSDCPNNWPSSARPAWTNTAYDLLVNDLGVTGFDLGAGVPAMVENTYDIWQTLVNTCDSYGYGSSQCLAAYSNYVTASRGAPVPGTFYWSYADWTKDRVWLPVIQRILNNGETPTFILTQGGAGNATYSWCQSGHESAFSNHIVNIYQKLATYGINPVGYEMLNEPDISPVAYYCTQNDYARLIKNVGAALISNGFAFTKAYVPTVESTDQVAPYFDSIWADTSTHQYIGGLSYHKYSGSQYCSSYDCSPCTEKTGIASRVSSNGLKSSMSEYIADNYASLHTDLKCANISYWDGQYALVGLVQWVGGWGAWLQVDETNPGNPVLTNNSKMVRQYSKFIRPGAVRIGAVRGASDTQIDPIAFINPGGKYAVVVKVSGSVTFNINGLANGTYGIKYAISGGVYDQNLPDQTVTSGTLPSSITMPGTGVITIYAKSAAPSDTTPPSNPVNLAATAISSSQVNLSWTASTDNVGVTGYRIFRGGTQVGTSASNSYSDTGLSPSTTYTYTVLAYDAAGNVSSQSASAQATTLAGGATTVRFYSSAGDGFVTNTVASGAWDSIHNALTGTSANYTGTYFYAGANLPPTWVEVSRGFLPFDTSGLPDNAVINSASLNIYAQSKLDGDNDGNDFEVAVHSSQANPIQLSIDDFDQCGPIHSAPEGSSRVDITNISTSAYTAFPINSTGLSWISKTGYTLFGIREGHDILDDVIAGFNRVQFYTSEQTGTAQDPYLEVTYTIGTDTTPPAAPTGLAVN